MEKVYDVETAVSDEPVKKTVEVDVKACTCIKRIESKISVVLYRLLNLLPSF